MILSVIKYNSPEYESMCELRDKILRIPIGLRLTKAETERDENDILIAALENEKAIACCILTQLDSDSVQLRQMAVETGYQHTGMGTKLLHFAEEIAKNSNYTYIKLHARKVAVDFYKKENYTAIGNEFTEVGIPHFEMIKTI